MSGIFGILAGRLTGWLTETFMGEDGYAKRLLSGYPRSTSYNVWSKGEDKMRPHKNHPIYGIAVPQPGKLWHPRGLVFAPDQNSTIEIKRLESSGLTFTTKKAAEEHALALCRAWIDEQNLELNSNL